MGAYFRKGAALALLASVSAPVLAQTTASQSTTGTTKIVQAITLTKTTDLAFGTVVKPATGANSVLIDATTGARTLTGAGTAALTTSTTSRAAFSVGGEGAQTFSITVPATFNMTSGANSLTVTLTTSAATGTLSGALGAAGTATFGVGGSFPIATTTVSGSYTGTFTTTVTYN
jgi:hypothetical protein